MNVPLAPEPSAPPPASLSHPDPEAGSLDERILRAELRLIAREDRLRRGMHTAAGQVRQAVSPRRLIVPVAGGAMAVGALWWLWRRAGRRASHSDPAAPARQNGAGSAPTDSAGPPCPPFWLELISLAWPMMPTAWRERLGPGTAGAITLALPLVERWLSRRRGAVPVAAKP